jgi:hypothetical protein
MERSLFWGAGLLGIFVGVAMIAASHLAVPVNAQQVELQSILWLYGYGCLFVSAFMFAMPFIQEHINRVETTEERVRAIRMQRLLSSGYPRRKRWFRQDNEISGGTTACDPEPKGWPTGTKSWRA